VLPGIGPHDAQSIIDARSFGSKEDLLKKKLIPQKTHDRMKGRVTSNSPKQRPQETSSA
jgi:DNA uptake protein ComE-like DNA-binding protein